MKKGSRYTIYIAASVGLLLGAYLLYLHYQPVTTPCGPGESMHCGEVNTSPYANLDGIFYLLHVHYQLPVPDVYISGTPFMNFVTSNAFLGMVMMVVFIVLAYLRKLSWVRGLALFSLLYGFYLFFIQHVVLETYCMYCLMVDAVIIVITVTAWLEKDEEPASVVE